MYVEQVETEIMIHNDVIFLKRINKRKLFLAVRECSSRSDRSVEKEKPR